MLAILCSGQGEQHREMFALSGRSDAAGPIFQLAAKHFDGIDPRVFVRDAPEQALYANRAGQLLCCTQALAAWAALRPVLPAQLIVAGYSAGELASWGCAGALGVEQTFMLAECRAEMMDEASPRGFGLLGVVGLDAQALQPIVDRHGFHVSIANDVDSFVVAGPLARFDAFASEAQQRGARRLKRLKVEVPSHTPLIARAAERFAQLLRRQPLHAPAAGIRLLCGVDAERVTNAGAGARKLAAQIGQTIRWDACLQTLPEYGATAVLELGPGDALCRMIDNRAGFPAARAFEHFRHLDGVRAWVAAHR